MRVVLAEPRATDERNNPFMAWIEKGPPPEAARDGEAGLPFIGPLRRCLEAAMVDEVFVRSVSYIEGEYRCRFTAYRDGRCVTVDVFAGQP